MVSQRKVLGKAPIIFVTVGTTQFSCVRFFRLIDETLHLYKGDVKLIVQQGSTEYMWQYPNRETYTTISPKQMATYIKEADKIITHAGFGTLYTIFQNHGVNPFIISRQKKYQEHVNDHQKYFLTFLKQKMTEPSTHWIFSDPTVSDLLSYISEQNRLTADGFDKIFSRTEPTTMIKGLTNYILNK